MAEYLVLIYDSEDARLSASSEATGRLREGHRRFGEANNGAIRGGNALQPTSTATSLRHEPSGELTVTDGAFAETKEALAGYYLLEAADLDEAIALAGQVPTYAGGVEVRPVMVLD
jgi:hypothetical protein